MQEGSTQEDILGTFHGQEIKKSSKYVYHTVLSMTFQAIEEGAKLAICVYYR